MDTENLLKSLNGRNVRYVIIGASAFPVYGYVRATLDLDIFIEPEPGNAEKALKALADFGYDVSELSIQDLLTKKVLLRQYSVETDMHPFVEGVTFEEVWCSKIESFYGETAAYFADLKSLIKMKKAAGRPKDLEDLKYLQRLLDGDVDSKQ